MDDYIYVNSDFTDRISLEFVFSGAPDMKKGPTIKNFEYGLHIIKNFISCSSCCANVDDVWLLRNYVSYEKNEKRLNSFRKKWSQLN